MKKKQILIKNIFIMIDSILTGYLLLFANRDAWYVQAFGWWQFGAGVLMLAIIFFYGIVRLLVEDDK